MAKSFIAKLRYVRIAPRKVRAVANSLKGLSVNEAEAQLLFQRRRPAPPLLKLLRSAVANARVAQADVEKLFVKSCTVDKGTAMKRSLPRARGSASPIHKIMSHVILTLEEREAARPSRFNIVVTKKAKKEAGEGKKRKAKAPKEAPHEEQIGRKAEGGKRGLFHKVFRRKTGGGE